MKELPRKLKEFEDFLGDKKFFVSDVVSTDEVLELNSNINCKKTIFHFYRLPLNCSPLSLILRCMSYWTSTVPWIRNVWTTTRN